MQDLNQFDPYYRIHRWGPPYFKVNSKGHLIIRSFENGQEGDIYSLVQTLVARGIDAPILIRFDNILKNRIENLHQAFQTAISTFDYPKGYQIAYPIKVNPQKDVVEHIEKSGRPYAIALEVGSKPELLAVMTISDQPDSLLLCNGYKDKEYIELALLAKKLGKRTVIIVEQPYELPLIIETSKQLNISAEIGFRMKLASTGTGHWQTSSGELAKFGLTTYEIMQGIELLNKEGLIEWVKLLHFHLGSQVTSIQAIKKALKETSRMYVELKKDCPSLIYFDAGGGLAVDYDGTKSTADSSMNYSIEEYARDIVYTFKEVCSQAKVECPSLISESGRALVAHHSVLITEVIDVTLYQPPHFTLRSPPTPNSVLKNLYETYQEITPQNCQEALNDAQEIKESLLELFLQGHLTLQERAYGENLLRLYLIKIQEVSRQLSSTPQEFEKNFEKQRDTYFCNFSVFQSLPDSWAIDQLFPIAPIHRLNEIPTCKAILADMTCDSDGKIDHFIGERYPEKTLSLHPFTNQPYYLGIFFVGAYQEILGDLHNLFGDTNAVHVELNSEGEWLINQVVEGDTMEEVLSYAQYHPLQLTKNLQILLEKSLRNKSMTNEESALMLKKFKTALENYTYLTI